MANIDILTVLQSKQKSPLDFMFDTLTAPPMLSFFNWSDIQRLSNITTSLRYSGNVKKKRDAIEQVMKSRGFNLLTAGTNRLTFSTYEFPQLVAKVAFDVAGMSDAPAEYQNQFLLAPFVTKIFEHSPDGVISFSERVQPITSREEFLSIADDYYDLLTNFIIGKYILEDIGTDFFMNVGMRTGFGPVLLDFPYVFKLDGGKLYCNNKPLGSFNAQPCGGVIDYDDGFNKLICTKCGKRYLARDLKDNSLVQIVPITKGADIMVKVQLVKNGEIISTSEPETKTIQPPSSLNVRKKRWENTILETKPIEGGATLVLSTVNDDKKAKLVQSKNKQDEKRQLIVEKQRQFDEKVSEQLKTPLPIYDGGDLVATNTVTEKVLTVDLGVQSTIKNHSNEPIIIVGSTNEHIEQPDETVEQEVKQDTETANPTVSTTSKENIVHAEASAIPGLGINSSQNDVLAALGLSDKDFEESSENEESTESAPKEEESTSNEDCDTENVEQSSEDDEDSDYDSNDESDYDEDSDEFENELENESDYSEYEQESSFEKIPRSKKKLELY